MEGIASVYDRWGENARSGEGGAKAKPRCPVSAFGQSRPGKASDELGDEQYLSLGATLRIFGPRGGERMRGRLRGD